MRTGSFSRPFFDGVEQGVLVCNPAASPACLRSPFAFPLLPFTSPRSLFAFQPIHFARPTFSQASFLIPPALLLIWLTRSALSPPFPLISLTLSAPPLPRLLILPAAPLISLPRQAEWGGGGVSVGAFGGVESCGREGAEKTKFCSFLGDWGAVLGGENARGGRVFGRKSADLNFF